MPGFRYRNRSSEDFSRLARLAYDTSKEHCGACRDFHVMWPYLRSLGLNGAGPEYNWPLHVDALARAAAGRPAVRWFLAGSADAGLLAVAQEAAARIPDAVHSFAMRDLCGTPVALCRDHARAHGLDLDAAVGDLAAYRPERPFDVVLMHQLLYFIPEADQPGFLAHAGRWLAPGGRLLLTVSVEAAARAPRGERDEAMVVWRTDAIRADVASGRLDLPEDIDTFLGRLRGTRAGRAVARPPARSLETFVALVESAGLAVEEAFPTPNEPGQTAPARDDESRTRYMIVATPAG
ncbi:MAG: class I SAM-dependent methyltransferase [Bauldia sp.]